MFAFAFNQGYISGIFGQYYLGYNFENVDKTKPLEWEKIVIKSIKESLYYKKLLNIFSKDELDDFDEGLKIGTFNGIAIAFNAMNMFFWDSKQYKKIIHEKEPYYFGVYGISKIGKHIIYKNKEIGKVIFMQAWGIPDYITEVRVENGCDRCGYTKFCNCYSFSNKNYKMAGCHDHHFGHGICIICGENSKSTKNFMCNECYDPTIPCREDYLKDKGDKYKYITDFRRIIYHSQDHKRTFFKNNNLKCLNCDKDVDPMIGLISCSRECNSELMKKEI
jgi:hypothetical protein